MMKNIIQAKLNEVLAKVSNEEAEYTLESYKKLKSALSSRVVSEKLKISEAILVEFEEALKQYFQYRDDKVKSRISCFRLSLWLETICKNLGISFSLDESISNEEIAIKQVRALELIIRDVVNENLGGKENVFLKLQELFKQDIVEKWLKSADDTGVLSGTTFSELSAIFLDKNIFKSIEEIVDTSQLKLSKSSRDSLRFILEDIRLIRNSIAHNKKISSIQIEALNEYYRAIANLIKESKSNRINPDSYLDLDKVKMEEFISGLKEDNTIIIAGIDEIKSDVKSLKIESFIISKRTKILILGTSLIVLISLIVLFFVGKQNSLSNEINEKQDVIIDQMADMQNMLKGATPILNPTTPKDFIMNAYLYKNAGDLIKSELMFNKFITTTQLDKFDVYYDYLDVLESNHSKKEAVLIINKVSNNSEISALATAFKQNKFNYKKFDSLISTNKSDSVLISFIQFLNAVNKNTELSNIIDSKYLIGYQINLTLKLIEWRRQFGDHYQNIQHHFYVKNGPENFACKNTESYATTASVFYVTMLRSLKMIIECDYNKMPSIFSEMKIDRNEYNKYSLKDIDELIDKESNMK